MLGVRRGQGAHRCCPGGQQAGAQPPPTAWGRGSGAWAVREQWEAGQVSEERTWFRAERRQLRVAAERRGKATPGGGCRGSGQRQLGDAGGLGAHGASFFPETSRRPEALSRGAGPHPPGYPSHGHINLHSELQGGDQGPKSPSPSWGVGSLSGRWTFRKPRMTPAPRQTRVAGRGRPGR